MESATYSLTVVITRTSPTKTKGKEKSFESNYISLQENYEGTYFQSKQRQYHVVKHIFFNRDQCMEDLPAPGGIGSMSKLSKMAQRNSSEAYTTFTSALLSI